jgi:hypothetical protein
VEFLGASTVVYTTPLVDLGQPLDLIGHGDKVNDTTAVTPNAKALFEKSFASYSLV